MKRKNLLSNREFEVMLLVSKGNSNKKIAVLLYCGIDNVKKHLQNIFPKLGVHNRTQATIVFLKIRGSLSN